MGKKLIICEKPSLAKSVSNAISRQGHEMTFKGSYSENEEYIVVPSFGHIFELQNIEEYLKLPAKTPWNNEILPFFPENNKFVFNLKNDEGIKRQFKVIKDLIHRNEVDTIVNCGDADREGEIIIRIILTEAKNTKPVKRLWLNNQTSDTIIKKLNNLEDSSVYDQLAEEGYTRMFIDWLYGINLTRNITIKAGSLQRVGRVKSAILRILYDRNVSINSFIPRNYYSVISTSNGFKLTSAVEFDIDDLTGAKNYSNSLNQSGTIVESIHAKDKKESSAKLFSLSTLQNSLSKSDQFSPSKTLKIAQSLYEKTITSYPRADTEYVAEEEKSDIQNVIEFLNQEGIVFKDSKRIFDSSKVKSHSAITPTPSEFDIELLSADEKTVYNTIKNRFLAVFCEEDRIISETIMTIKSGELETFKLKGTVEKQIGWKKFEYSSTPKKEVKLPNLAIKQELDVKFEPIETQTKPKPQFTVETLNKYLVNPFRQESDKSDDSHYKAILSGATIGTEATRAGILEQLVKDEYISFTKTVYKIEEKGIKLIKILDLLKIDMSTQATIDLSLKLNDVYIGTNDIDSLLVDVTYAIKTIFANSESIVIPDELKTEKERKIIGLCRNCNSPMFEGDTNYYCSSYKSGCQFSISKRIASKNISETNIKKLINNGKSAKISGFKSSVGKAFSAILILDKNNKITFEFAQNKNRKTASKLKETI